MKNMWFKIKYILTRKEKRNLVILFILMLFGGLMEMAGVSLILPLIGFIINNDNPDMKRIAVLAVVLIGVYVIKKSVFSINVLGYLSFCL